MEKEHQHLIVQRSPSPHAVALTQALGVLDEAPVANPCPLLKKSFLSGSISQPGPAGTVVSARQWLYALLTDTAEQAKTLSLEFRFAGFWACSSLAKAQKPRAHLGLKAEHVIMCGCMSPFYCSSLTA